MRECDFLIVGAGIAGASVGYFLSKKHKVDMRTAAYMVAVHRVAEATLTRGIYP